MSSIDGKTKEELYKWALQHEDKRIFSVASVEEDSYYIARHSEDTYMMEYSFENIAELRRALEEYAGLSLDSEMMQMLLVRICQGRYKNRVEAYTGSSEEIPREEKGGTAELPEFVYVF